MPSPALPASRRLTRVIRPTYVMTIITYRARGIGAGYQGEISRAGPPIVGRCRGHAAARHRASERLARRPERYAHHALASCPPRGDVHQPGAPARDRACPPIRRDRSAVFPAQGSGCHDDIRHPGHLCGSNASGVGSSPTMGCGMSNAGKGANAGKEGKNKEKIAQAGTRQRKEERKQAGEEVREEARTNTNEGKKLERQEQERSSNRGRESGGQRKEEWTERRGGRRTQIKLEKEKEGGENRRSKNDESETAM